MRLTKLPITITKKINSSATAAGTPEKLKSTQSTAPEGELGKCLKRSFYIVPTWHLNYANNSHVSKTHFEN